MSDRPTTCGECRYWEKDRGVWTATGWTGSDRENGYCHVEPKVTPRKASELSCRYAEARP